MLDNNPRPEFMAKLKTFCKNLEGEVKHLDGEVKAALLHNKVMKYFQHSPPVIMRICVVFRAAVTWQQRGCTMMFCSSKPR